MIDRTIAPKSKEIKNIQLPKVEKVILSNQLPVYLIDAGKQDVIKIDFIFNAGTAFQDEPLCASTANKTIIEGSKKYNSKAISTFLDFHGAFLETESEKDKAYISLYSVHKHLEKLFPLLEDIIKNPIFPEKELKTFLANQKQQYIVNLEKVSFLARLKFAAMLFGEQHPYGQYAKPEDFDSLNLKSLISFYKNYYNSNNCHIIVSGKIPNNLITLIEKHFGKNDWQNPDVKKNIDFNWNVVDNSAKKELVYRDQALQSAIRIGRILFNKTNVDFIKMQVLNTILGGYFGSRLMKNIREDKGYTYGIGSGIISLKHAGFFFISSEVGVDVCNKAIDEVYKELNTLCTQSIIDEELTLVQNYMLGVLMKALDGPFALAERLRDLLDYNLDFSYYTNYIEEIRNVKGIELNELAQKYLQPTMMYELIVGKKM